MTINQFSGLCIMTLIAVFVLTVTAIPATPASLAQNMTGAENMTNEGTNLTGTNTTGIISSSDNIIENHITPNSD